MTMNRRQIIAAGLVGTLFGRPAAAQTPLVIGWTDLIPPGVPYSEIIGEGEIDRDNDTWDPIFDGNATKLNERLDGALIRMPGFIIPLEIGTNGVTDFVLVPYVGACIHTPPPPPNQLVLAQTKEPWPSNNLWDPIWVTGVMRTKLQSTEIAQTGYALSIRSMEFYDW